MGPHSDERTSLPVSKPGLKIQESCILDWIPAFPGMTVRARDEWWLEEVRRYEGFRARLCYTADH